MDGVDVRGDNLSAERCQNKYNKNDPSWIRRTTTTRASICCLYVFYRCKERQLERSVHPKETADPKKETEE